MQALATNPLVKKYTRHGVYEIETPPLSSKSKADYVIDVTHWYLETTLVDDIIDAKASHIIGQKVIGRVTESRRIDHKFEIGDTVIVKTLNCGKGLFSRKLEANETQLTYYQNDNAVTFARHADTIHDVLRVLTELNSERSKGRWISI